MESIANISIIDETMIIDPKLKPQKVEKKKNEKPDKKNEKPDKKNEKPDKKNEKPEKKKPGRPRKTPIRPPRSRNGIVNSPGDPSNHIEFLYDRPLIFKKIWQHFKLMAVNKMQFIFRHDEVIIWNQDHHKKSQMRTRINVDKINHYFAQEELDIGMVCKNPELIIYAIDSSYNSILFLSKEGYTKKDLRVILTNDIGIDDVHRIELVGDYDRMENEEAFLKEDEYTIKFTLPGKYFKKMVSDIKSFSDQITIKQDGKGEPIRFEYTKRDKKIRSYRTVKNSKSINLESKLKEGETFRVSFKIDYIKPISSALLADEITICAHEGKPLLFIVTMDKQTVDMRILTDVITTRV
jgi:hypothetical protein